MCRGGRRAGGAGSEYPVILTPGAASISVLIVLSTPHQNITHNLRLAGSGHSLLPLQRLGHSFQTVLQELPAPGQHHRLAHLRLLHRPCQPPGHPGYQVQDHVHGERVLGKGPRELCKVVLTVALIVCISPVRNYVRHGRFVYDLLALAPLDLLYLQFGLQWRILRLPRLMKYGDFTEFFTRLGQSNQLDGLGCDMMHFRRQNSALSSGAETLQELHLHGLPHTSQRLRLLCHLLLRGSGQQQLCVRWGWKCILQMLLLCY